VQEVNGTDRLKKQQRSRTMCPSCEKRTGATNGDVCRACEAIYIQSLGLDWRQTETGRFLLGSNKETTEMNNRIAHTPTGYAIDAVAAPSEAEVDVVPVSAAVDQMIGALVHKHKWGYRRVHAFLQIGGYDVPSLSTVKRRVVRARVLV
jgi:hypothetical protein